MFRIILFLLIVSQTFYNFGMESEQKDFLLSLPPEIFRKIIEYIVYRCPHDLAFKYICRLRQANKQLNDLLTDTIYMDCITEQLIENAKKNHSSLHFCPNREKVTITALWGTPSALAILKHTPHETKKDILARHFFYCTINKTDKQLLKSLLRSGLENKKNEYRFYRKENINGKSCMCTYYLTPLQMALHFFGNDSKELVERVLETNPDEKITTEELDEYISDNCVKEQIKSILISHNTYQETSFKL